MTPFKVFSAIAAAMVVFVLTVIVLTVFGYEIQRDTPFEIRCEEAGGIYFLSKGNSEFCVKKDIFFEP